MNEKHRKVQSWLECVFGGDSVPPYEINQTSLDILHDLMVKNEQQDKSAALIVEDWQQKGDEYSVEADRLAGVLSQLGLTPDALSQSGTVSLRTLASVASLLQTKDASNTALLLALAENDRASLRLKEARRAEQRACATLMSKTKAALLRGNSLDKALQSLEEQAKRQGPDLAYKAKQAAFLQNKAKQYRTHVQDKQLELSRSGADPSIYHSQLLAKSEDLKQLKESLHPVKAKLDSYHKLPPDVSLARVKVEEAKRELAALDEQLNKHIDLMHM